jgi:hypothetical protein
MVMLYVYFYEHKISIDDSEVWSTAFQRVGLQKEIPLVTHDEEMWYHRGIATCVGYSGNISGEKSCDRSIFYCPGSVAKYGTAEEQALAVREAIRAGGEHPKCPLIYPGGD